MRFVFTLLLVTFISRSLHAQQVMISADKKPLNEVLRGLSEKYKISISYSDDLVKYCIVSKHKKYLSAKKAIQDLIRDCQLKLSVQENVYIISPKPKKEDQHKTFNFQIIDYRSRESVPFANITIEQTHYQTDAHGKFSYRSKLNKLPLIISRTGYYPLDTAIDHVEQIQVSIHPQIIDLQKVIIQNKKNEVSVIDQRISLDNKTTPIPGSRDNKVFNHLRLQSGFLAAGEQSNNYSVWSSYPGQTLLYFDNIPVFNAATYNQNIGAVNPLLLKDMDIRKGAFSAQMPDQVGGLINIKGKDGHPDKTEIEAHINNLTANVLLGIPITKNNTIQTALRFAYGNPFEQLSRVSNNKQNGSNYQSNSAFKDGNIKWTGGNKNGDQYSISMMSNKDQQFNKFFSDKTSGVDLTNNQIQNFNGIAGNYNKRWKKLGHTNIKIHYANLQTQLTNNIYSINKDSLLSNEMYNGLSQLEASVLHHFPTYKKHKLSAGVSFDNSRSTFSLDNSLLYNTKVSTSIAPFNFVIEDAIFFSKKIQLRLGLRTVCLSQKVSPQTRVQLNIRPNKNLGLQLAWGMHRQYVIQQAVIDQLNNQFYRWSVADNIHSPIPRSVHYTARFNYNKNNFDFRAEVFYRRTKQLSQIDYKNDKLTIHPGESKHLGLGLQLHKKLNRHNIQLTYNLGGTLERFAYFPSYEFALAPQDQRHEVKPSLSLNFSPIHISLTYVYGSGFAFQQSNPIAYHRMDVALLYKFNEKNWGNKKLKMEAGLSILNLLNRNNIRYAHPFDDGKNVFYSQGVPLTPILFFSLKI